MGEDSSLAAARASRERCARLACGSWRRGRQRVFPGRVQDLRQAAAAGEPRAFLRECLDSFEAPPEKKCEICGQALGWLTAREGEPLVCHACQQKTYAFERARSYGIYDGPLVRAIFLLKWERMEPLGDWFAGRLAEMVQREAALSGYGRGRAGSAAPGPRAAARVQPGKPYLEATGSEAGAAA